MTKFLNDIKLEEGNDIQFKTTAGSNAGKISQTGDDLVISNAVGDILLGNGSDDIYIGDGTNTVDIRFEQDMAIFADSGSAKTLTIGGANTTLVLDTPTFSGTLTLGATTINNKLTFTTANGYILFDYEPSGDTGEYTTEVPLLKIDHNGTEKTILSRVSENGGIQLGHDDSVWITAGDVGDTIKTNNGATSEVVILASEYGFRSYGFPNNDTAWSNRNEFLFYAGNSTAADNGLYIGDGGGTQFIDLSRNLKNIGTIASGAITSTVASTHVSGNITATNAHLDLYNNWESNTDQKGSIITFTDNYYDGSSYYKTTRAAIKGGTDTVGNTADGYLEFYTDSSGGNSPTLALRLDKDQNATFSGTVQVGVDDTGHDVKFFGATSGKYLLWDESDDRLWLTDNTHLELGTGGDLQMLHNGSASFIQNYNGDLKIINNANDKDIIFQSDDGSGGVTAYLTLDGSLGYTTVDKTIRFNDNVKAVFGSGLDLQLYHNGSHSYIENNVGNIAITNNTDDGDIILSSDDGSGGTTAYLTLDGSAGYITAQKEIRLADAQPLRVGTGGDTRLMHDGNDLYLENWTGSFNIRQHADDGDMIFQSDDGSGGVETYFYLDGSANSSGEPYTIWPDSSIAAWGNGSDFRIKHDGSNAYLYNTTGDIQIINYADDKDIVFQSDDGSGGNATYFYLDGSSATHDGSATTSLSTTWPDKSQVNFGSSRDTMLYHDGSNMTMYNFTGDLLFYNGQDDGNITFYCDDGSGGTTAYLTLDGGNTRTNIHKNMLFDDSVTLGIGASYDLQIYHNGSHSLISNQVGNLYLRNQTDDGDIIIQADDGSGGDATYMTFDGGLGYTTVQKRMRFDDNKEVQLGASGDLSLYHVSNQSYIDNSTGNLNIRQKADDKDIIFQCDDGSGGVETYFYLDGSLSSGNPYTVFPDDSRLAIGTGADLVAYHNGSNSYISNGTGNLTIKNTDDNKDIIFQSDDGSGGTTTYLTLDGGFSVPYVAMEDNTILALGTHKDLLITHDGTNSKIDNMNTGDLKIRNFADDKDIIFQSDNGAGSIATYFSLDGSLATHDGSATTNLYTVWPDLSNITLGNSQDFSMKHDGTDTIFNNQTGNFVLRNSADDKDIIFQSDNGSGGTATYLALDGGISSILVYRDILMANDGNDGNIKLGASQDLVLNHDGTSSIIQNATGDLKIINYADDKDIRFFSDDGSGGVAEYLTIDGSAGTVEVAKEMNLTVPLATDQQKHLAWFEIAGFGTGDGTNYEISVNLDNDTAPFSHNVSTGADGTTAITVQNIMRSGGTVMPRAGTVKRWKGWATTAGSSTANVALFKITPARNDNSDVEPVLIDNVSYTAVGNAKMMDFDETSFTDASVAAGDIVVTGIKCEDTKVTYFSSTLEIEF